MVTPCPIAPVLCQAAKVCVSNAASVSIRFLGDNAGDMSHLIADGERPNSCGIPGKSHPALHIVGGVEYVRPGCCGQLGGLSVHLGCDVFGGSYLLVAACRWGAGACAF